MSQHDACECYTRVGVHERACERAGARRVLACVRARGRARGLCVGEMASVKHVAKSTRERSATSNATWASPSFSKSIGMWASLNIQLDHRRGAGRPLFKHLGSIHLWTVACSCLTIYLSKGYPTKSPFSGFPLNLSAQKTPDERNLHQRRCRKLSLLR